MSFIAISGALLLEVLMQSAAAPPPERPVVLEAQQTGDTVHIRVVARPGPPERLRYRLVTTGGKSGNRSAQQGVVMRSQDRSQTLVDLSLREPTGQWNAELEISLEDGRSYTIEM